MSPPRIVRLWLATPAISERAVEEIPAIAPTPSAMQAMNTTNPESPARISRNASLMTRPKPGLREGGRVGRVPCMSSGRLRPRRVGHNPPGAKLHDAVTTLRKRGIVGDQDKGRAALTLQREDEVGDRAPGRLVEVAGRFVGHHDRRVGCECAGDGDALLLTA